MAPIQITEVTYNAFYGKVTDAMKTNDSSHDMTHIKRVINNAQMLYNDERLTSPHITYNTSLIRVAALFHEIGDRKYCPQGADPKTLARDMILSTVDDPSTYREFAETVQKIVTGVSFTAEKENPKKVKKLIAEIPELAIVQDADRLDSIGATGLSRTIAYGAAMTPRPIEESNFWIGERMCTLKDWMKTDKAKEIAQKWTERMRRYLTEFAEEAALVGDWATAGTSPDAEHADGDVKREKVIQD